MSRIQRDDGHPDNVKANKLSIHTCRRDKVALANWTGRCGSCRAVFEVNYRVCCVTTADLVLYIYIYMQFIYLHRSFFCNLTLCLFSFRTPCVSYLTDCALICRRASVMSLVRLWFAHVQNVIILLILLHSHGYWSRLKPKRSWLPRPSLTSLRSPSPLSR